MGQEETEDGEAIDDPTLIPVSPDFLNLGEETYTQLPESDRSAYQEAMMEELGVDGGSLDDHEYTRYDLSDTEQVIVCETPHGDGKFLHLIKTQTESGEQHMWMIGPKDMLVPKDLRWD